MGHRCRTAVVALMLTLGAASCGEAQPVQTSASSEPDAVDGHFSVHLDDPRPDSYINAGERGTAGDVVIIRGRLDGDQSQRLGNVQARGTFTGRSRGEALFDAVFSLQEGQIIAEGIFDFESTGRKHAGLVITGGKRSYRHAVGRVQAVINGRGHATFEFFINR